MYKPFLLSLAAFEYPPRSAEAQGSNQQVGPAVMEGTWVSKGLFVTLIEQDMGRGGGGSLGPLVFSGDPRDTFPLWSHRKAVGSTTELAQPFSALAWDAPSPTELCRVCLVRGLGTLPGSANLVTAILVLLTSSWPSFHAASRLPVFLRAETREKCIARLPRLKL